jgi:chemotaxis protein histidine kinase CheA
MSDPLAEALKGLRREYLAEAPARVAELRALLEPVLAGDRTALDGLRRGLHKLAGSGGSYGFAEVSAASRAGEQVARRLLESNEAVGAADGAALRESVEAVDRAFAQARAAEEHRDTA